MTAPAVLWLDWALDESWLIMDVQGGIKGVAAEHDGYRKQGVLHIAAAETTNTGWAFTEICCLFDCR